MVEASKNHSDLPRVLLLSHEIPQTVYAGCVILHRLFANYPPDRLRVIGPSVHADAARLGCRYDTIVPPLARVGSTRFAELRNSLDAFGVLPRISNGTIRSMLDGFAPQVVVSVWEERETYAAYRYARANQLPLVLIVHDQPDLFDPVKPWARRRQLARDAAMYAYASGRLCVSPQMARRLEKMYGVPGQVLYPSRSDDLVPRAIEESATLKDGAKLTIGYAGSLAYGYGPQIRKLAASLRGSDVRLRLHSMVEATDPLITEFGDVVFCAGYGPAAQAWARIKRECDAVILPYPWDASPQQQDLYRTHFPSKLTEYVALGMPVIVTGPADATGAAWIKDHPGSGLWIDDPSPLQWRKDLESLRLNSQLRMELARGAIENGSIDFDPGAIRDYFLKVLRESV